MAKLTVHIISEDSSRDSFEVIKNIIIASFRSIEPNFDENKIQFDGYFNKNSCITGTQWKAKRGMEFRKFMTELMGELKKESSYVFWHIDGDIAFSDFEKDTDTSDNFSTFHKQIKKIPHTVKIEGKEIPIDFTKLFLLFPCYSIESWLYPFIDKIKLDNIKEFTFSSTALEDFDEILQIKDNSGIGSKYNLELSTSFKHNTLEVLKKSYSASYNKYSSHSDFISKLRSIKPEWANTTPE